MHAPVPVPVQPRVVATSILLFPQTRSGVHFTRGGLRGVHVLSHGAQRVQWHDHSMQQHHTPLELHRRLAALGALIDFCTVPRAIDK